MSTLLAITLKCWSFTHKGPTMQSCDVFFIVSLSEQSFEVTIKLLVFWDAMLLLWHQNDMISEMPWCSCDVNAMTWCDMLLLAWTQFLNCIRTCGYWYQHPDLVIIVPADDLAPKGARPSAGTALTTKFNMFSCRYLWLSWLFIYFRWPDDFIQNGQRVLEKSRGTLGVNWSTWS